MDDRNGIDEVVLLAHGNQFSLELGIDFFNDQIDSR